MCLRGPDLSYANVPGGPGGLASGSDTSSNGFAKPISQNNISILKDIVIQRVSSP
jgi:hypothetical protein